MARKNTSDEAVAAQAGKKQKKPKKTRWYHQIFQVYKLTVKHDPKTRWIMLGLFLGIVAAGVGLGLILNQVAYITILAVPFALLAAMFVLARRAEAVQYNMIDGQPGAASAALGTIRRGWAFESDPIDFDPKTQDMVFRGVGRPGVVLVTEGPAQRVDKLVAKEERKLKRILPGVPVTVIQCGKDEGQVPLAKLARQVQKLKPAINKAELSEVHKRLTALGKMRLPIPKGVDPMRARPDRKGMR